MRSMWVWLAGLFCAVSALAQVQVQPVQPAPPLRPQPQQPAAEQPLQGEQKLRWVCRQLRLDDKQMQQAEALIAVYKAECEAQKSDPQALLLKIQDKYAEIQAAQSAGNTDLINQLRAEMKSLAPGVQPENNFFEGLEQVLTDEQKAKLPAIRKRAETGGEVALRPIHVLRAARRLSLTAEQQDRLEKILDEYRTGLVTSRPENQEAVAARLDKLVQDVRAILTPTQAEAFDKEVNALREVAPPATPVKLPGTQAQSPPATTAPVMMQPGAPPPKVAPPGPERPDAGKKP